MNKRSRRGSEETFETYRLSTVLSISTRIAITARNSEKPDENQHHQRKLITIPMAENHKTVKQQYPSKVKDPLNGL
ncbi:hypothetical protein V1477_003329 [Vespula maculifrons]|uniref:Uncharacterized protein n=1 Tax=Vespula maculifrons TaxID=7453 RepID=A0ABD2CUA6_VESMC